MNTKIKHSLLLTAVLVALSNPVMAEDNSDGKRPRISDIQTTFVGDNIQLSINGVNFLGKNNANPLLSIGNGLFKAPDFKARLAIPKSSSLPPKRNSPVQIIWCGSVRMTSFPVKSPIFLI